MEPADADADRIASPGRTPWAEALAYVLAAVASLTGAIWVLRARPGNLAQPWFFRSDAIQETGWTRSILDHGWFWFNPDLGRPAGLHWSVFAQISGDLTPGILVRVIGVFVDNAFTATNVLFLLTFPLVAVAALWALRDLGVSRWPAVVLAVLYAMLPYHFERNVTHLSMSAYYTVPLLCVLLLDVLAGRPLFVANARANLITRWLSPRTLRTIGFCVLVGTTGAYYAAFGLVLLGSAAALRAIGTRSWRGSVAGLLAAGVVVATIILVQFPVLAHRGSDDAASLVGQRTAAESEAYGLKVDQLVFPIAEHRIGAFADLAGRMESTSPVASEPAANLGAVGTIGLAWLLVVGLGSLVGGCGGRIGSDEERRAALMTVVTILIATVGGGSAIIAFLVTPQVRAWNRMSVVIAFFALLGVGYLLDRVRRRSTVTVWRVAGGFGLALLLLVGILDQTTPRFTPEHAELAAEQSVLDQFAADAEAALPRDAQILQLPYIVYPEEGGANAMGGYDHLRVYLSSHDLRFSYPAIKGTTEDWQGPIAGAPLPVLLDAATALGFDAVSIDRRGFVDGGAVLAETLDHALGPAEVRSSDDELLLWDLRGRRAELRDRLGGGGVRRLRDAVARPVRAYFGDGFGLSTTVTGQTSRDALPDAMITVVNGLDHERRVVLDTELASLPNGATSATLDFPDGTRRRIRLGPEPARITHAFRAPAGHSTISIASRGAPTVDMRDTGSWHGAVGVPTTFDDRAITRVINPTVIPVDVCTAQTTPDATPADACTTGPRPQVP